MEKELPPFARATAKGEGMVANPDEFVWACDCDKCQAKYANWKKLFNMQQDAVNLASDPSGLKIRKKLNVKS
jgi:hypothetical protein